MYLVNCICDTESKTRFENNLRKYIHFEAIPFNLFMSMRRTPALGGLSFLPTIIVWGDNSPFSSPLNESLFMDKTIIPVLYATREYMEHNRRMIDERMKEVKWLFIDSETNEEFHLLIDIVKETEMKN